jgi:sugar phosphate isomerase/epimerase
MKSISRRQFVAAGVLGLAAARCPAREGGPETLEAEPGCQVYGVRQQLLADFDATLKQLHDIGYRNIEYCSPPGYGWDKGGLGKLSAGQTRRRIEAAGLRVVSCHYQYRELMEHLDERAAFARELGLQHMIVASVGRPKTLGEWMERADNLNRLGERVLKAGMRLGFHNHGQEWQEIDGVLVFDALTKRFDPKLVNWQFHLQNPASGRDPVDVIRTHPGRILSLHIMDYAAGDKGTVPVGQGVIDWKKLFAAAKASGVRYTFVEMGMEDLKASLPYLRTLKV